MNEILKKAKLKKIKVTILVVLIILLVSTATYFTISIIKNNKVASNNEKDNNQSLVVPTYSDDSIDYDNIDIKEVLNGTWYSCNDEFCYEFTYDKEHNHTILGEVLSDGIFDGSIDKITKLNDYRYELAIKHSKVECEDFGKITEEECEMLCLELLCDEEYRTYQVDISKLNENKIYIKVLEIDDYFDKFTSFGNSLGINIPYDDNREVLDRFKNNMQILDE